MTSQAFLMTSFVKSFDRKSEKSVWPNETLQHFGNISIIIIIRVSKASSNPWPRSCLILLYAMILKLITCVIICKLIRICAEHDDISDTNKIFTALQCLTILLSYAKQCPTMLLSGIILCICDIIAMSDNIIIWIYNNHVNVWQFTALMVFLSFLKLASY